MTGNGTMKNKIAAVVGAGASGRAAALLLADLGAEVRLLERNVDLDAAVVRELEIAGVQVRLGNHEADDFKDVELVVPSPGVPARKLRALFPMDKEPELISELELASRYAQGQVLAITGTNGKTTCTSLAAHVLQHLEKRVFVGGNIGTPLSEHVLSGREADILVLEVSSFQAQNCTTFRPDVGVLLNFSPDHLDYHADMQEYLQAKLNMFARMTRDEFAVISEELRELLAERFFTQAMIRWFQSTDRFECDHLPGAHNQSNMEAVFQATRRFGVTERCMRDALGTFEPHPHRLQVLGKVQGITFVNDSKATTVDSLRAALDAFDHPILLLAGGKYKGGDLESLVPLLRRKARAVCLYGASRKDFESAWAGHVPLAWEPEMEKAVKRLMTWAEEGDVMLLSPATASYDQYANYQERGNDFKRVFEELG